MIRFVGGPLHGKEVPDDLPRYRLPFDRSIEAVRVNVLSRELMKGGIVFHERAYLYIKMPHWMGIGKPLVYCFMQYGLDDETLIDLAHRLFCEG